MPEEAAEEDPNLADTRKSFPSKEIAEEEVLDSPTSKTAAATNSCSSRNSNNIDNNSSSNKQQ